MMGRKKPIRKGLWEKAKELFKKFETRPIRKAYF